MIRLYLWFLGVEGDRPGGPWWFKDLPHPVAIDLFLADVKPFLYAFSIVPETEIDHKATYIVPPALAKINYPNKREKEWSKC